jgi:hypothetical protein
MAAARVPALRHLLSCSARGLRASNQRRWAQVHDVRFLATTQQPRSVLEKYRDKLDQKARAEGHENIDSLKAAYSDKIHALRKEADPIATPPTPPPSPEPSSPSTTPTPPPPRAPRDDVGFLAQRVDLVGVGGLEGVDVLVALGAGFLVEFFAVLFEHAARLLGGREEADVVHLRPAPLVRGA